MSDQFLPDLIRLTNISGFDNRSNDVVYCRPSTNVENPNVCVFFGGDVQDFTENMLSHRDNKNHVQWNLENTAKLLQHSFVDSHIVVVRPVRMEYRTFSCYENFVQCTHCGVPEHLPMYNGLQHLEELLHNVSVKIQNMTEQELNDSVQIAKNGLVDGTNSPQNAANIPTRNTLNLDECNVTLVGFSKGCVVLNQFLYEFDYYSSNAVATNLKIIPKIREMYWLDGGHSGGKNTWMTSANLLESIAKLGIRIMVHVTPYQIEDERRPWIKKEEKLFSDTLKKLGVPIRRIVHFDDIPASIQNHFNVLNVFKSADNS
ncbi:unnamed protein product [Psylliodes chrysocephalus]|uniref:Uncharacterized protein n=1 Tax=Psylliodes chrysocephalus TaxID=3402493 RepID=A0A9P0D9R1_9CUCU|nr:unnamed protein product [Psylliodes chrysocephala]